MSKSEICVLIAGVGGKTPGMELIKSFKMASNKYKIVATDMYPNSIGLFSTPYRYVIPPASSSKYIDTLLKICKIENVNALTTGSAIELGKVASNAKIFEENGIKLLLNPLQVIERCNDKYNLMKFLSNKGITCPKYFLFEDESSVNNVEKYPVIIKPKSGSGSRDIFIAQDREELIFFGKYLKKRDSQPLVQEYLEPYEEEYTVGVLYVDNGKLFNSIAMKRLLSHGFSCGQIIENSKSKKKYITSSYISEGYFDDFKEIRNVCEKIAKVIGANGPINIQCRKTSSGVIPFEINPRFSATLTARSLVGCNEPDILCRYLFFDEIPAKIEYKFGYVLRNLVEQFVSLQEIENVSKI